jgi:hypothetical protein
MNIYEKVQKIKVELIGLQVKEIGQKQVRRV